MTHVVISGLEDAPPLVLLHGFSTTSAMWSPKIAEFSKDHRVYAIDVMGQPGKTIPDPDEPIREVVDFMTWLHEVLDGLGLDRISLVGMSNGGWLGITFAMAAPERVQKLVLLSPAACFQPLVRQFGLRVLLLMFFTSRLTSDTLMGWMGVKGTPDNPANQCLLDLFYLGMKYFRQPPETARLFPVEFSDDELRKLDVPVLLLIGDKEVIYDPAKALDRARRLIPNFEGELVPGGNHNMCSSQYSKVNARVLEFLNGN